MKAFNQGFFKFIIILSLLPLLPAFLLALSPAGLLVAGLVAYFGWRSFRRGVNSTFGMIGAFISRLFRGTGQLVLGVFKVFGWALRGFGVSLGWLWRGPKADARFMGWFERQKLLNSNHQGPLIDGRSKRLSEEAGYESLLVQGGMGRGKSSAIVLPNLLSPPPSLPSFVVSDTSGELFQKSSGYLANRGYVIRALNLMTPSASETYNPLTRATSP